MADLLYIAGAVALLALAGLFIYLIIFVKGSRELIDNAIQTVQTLTREIQAMRENFGGTMLNVEKVVGNLSNTVDQLNGTVRRVNNQLDHIEGVVENVKLISAEATEVVGDAADVIHSAKNVVVSVIDLEQNIQRKVEEPVLEVMTLFSALGKGLRRFREKLSAPSANGAPARPERSPLPSPPGPVPQAAEEQQQSNVEI